MDVLPFPSDPQLRQYEERAERLVTAAASGRPGDLRGWAAGWMDEIAADRSAGITPIVQSSIDRATARMEERARAESGGALPIEDARRLIAHAHGFEDWQAFAKHLTPDPGDTSSRDFEAAAGAVVTGALPALEALIRGAPDLVRARSERRHRATLLHYIAANGVEDFRQLTPPNAVAIARFLLQSGAEVDALAETYGGGSDQTTLNLLVSSCHPAEAGLQSALVEVLLDHGAAINGLGDDCSPLMTALAFGYPDTAETLAARGARMDSVLAAAALGRLDLVRSFVPDRATVRSGETLAAPGWLNLRERPGAHIELALVWACRYGRTEVVEFLLDRGVDPGAKDREDMTGLHWAAAAGAMEVVRLLLHRGAPLEVTNRWGGTVLDSTAYFALRQPFPGVDYPPVIKALVEGGADVGAAHPRPTGVASIDQALGLPGLPSQPQALQVGTDCDLIGG